MLDGNTRIPPIDVETLPDDLRETLEEQEKLRGAPLYPYLFYRAPGGMGHSRPRTVKTCGSLRMIISLGRNARGATHHAFRQGAIMSTVPQGLDPKIQTREIVFEADVSLVTPFLKLATVSRGGGDGHMTFASDEGPSLGGLGSAPTPLMYFSAALAF